MIKIYTNNPDCPYCIKAKQFLTNKGLAFEYLLVDKAQIKELFPEATTVPQIAADNLHIGGYDELVKLYEVKENKPRTVFNADNKGHETGVYPLFFGEQLGFADSITSPYPILDELYQTQMSQIWNEFEIDLTQDRQDMLNVERPVVDLMVLNLLLSLIHI